MKKILLLTALLIGTLSYTAQAKKIKYKTLPSGLRYAVFHDEPGQTGQSGGAIFFYIEVYTAKKGQPDSLVSGAASEQAILLTETPTPGNIEELLFRLSPGDSAACLVNVKLFFQEEPIPEFLSSTEDLFFVIKVTKLMSPQEVKEYSASRQQQQEQQRQQMYTTRMEQIKAYKEELVATESVQAQLKQDDALLKDYLQKNKIEAQRTEYGVYYVVHSAGTGKQNVAGEKLTVHYKGMLLNGEVFDASEGRGPFEFTLGIGEVILGWDEALLLLKKGDKATIYIPSVFAYGEQGSPPAIPANSCLIFEVEIME